MTTTDLTTTAMAVGGEAVAREDSGRVVFVSGAAPGESVRVEITDERRTFARANVLRVLSPSPDRVDPPCPEVAAGCGGCNWQHLSEEAQRRFRSELVHGVLTREGGVADPLVRPGPPIPAEHVRTTVRGTTDDNGRFSFRRRRSNEPIAVETCLISHPLIAELITEGRFGDAEEVTLRVGSRTGERLVVVGPTAEGLRLPDDVVVVGTDELKKGRRAWFHEQAEGRTWRVSARSFFQASPEGAEALVSAVGDAVTRLSPDADRMVDLCSGVGLFAGTVGAGMRTTGVERSADAVADARHNLAGLDTRLLRLPLAKWRPSAADVVVADPARSGLGRTGVDAVAATGAGLCVLVSCDPAALGRDARLLAEAGFEHAGSEVLDLFGHTGEVEVVTAFVRS